MDKATHKQIAAITSMVAFYTIGDKDAHSIVTSEAVGVLTGIYKLPQDMDKFEARRAMDGLIDRRRKKAGRVYHIQKGIVNDYLNNIRKANGREMDI